MRMRLDLQNVQDDVRHICLQLVGEAKTGVEHKLLLLLTFIMRHVSGTGPFKGKYNIKNNEIKNNNIINEYS